VGFDSPHAANNNKTKTDVFFMATFAYTKIERLAYRNSSRFVKRKMITFGTSEREQRELRAFRVANRNCRP
jgi:hypothetical protein